MKNITDLLKLLSLFCVLNSCAQNKDLKLEIVNNEIFCRENFNFTLENLGSVNHSITPYIIHQYDSIPINKINVKLSNSGTKPYMLFLTNNFTGFDWKNTVCFEVYDNQNQVQKSNELSLSSESMEAFSMRNAKNKREQAALKKELFKVHYRDTLDIDKIEFNQKFNCVIIHPNETKFITLYQGLPFFRFEQPFYMMYFLKSNQNYFFQVVIKNDATSNKSFLSENQLKEIKENGYEIFDGELKSNKVPIKFVRM